MEFLLPTNAYIDVLDYIFVTAVFLFFMVLICYGIFFFSRKVIKLFRESKEDKEKK